MKDEDVLLMCILGFIMFLIGLFFLYYSLTYI